MSYITNQAYLSVGSEITQGKKEIAAAINANGGTAQASESFTRLAHDISTIPNASAGDRIGSLIFQTPTNYRNGVDLIKSLAIADYSNNPIIEINDTQCTDITRNYAFAGLKHLKKVSFSAIENHIPDVSEVFLNCTALEVFRMDNLKTMDGKLEIFGGCVNLKYIAFPQLRTSTGGGFGSTNQGYAPKYVEEFYLPSLTYYNSYTFYGAQMLKKITFGKLTATSTINFPLCYWLNNIIVGEDTDINLNFSEVGSNTYWNNNIDAAEWNVNFVNGIVNKLHDYSGGTAHTITLGTYAKAKLTAATIALANAKGWTIA